MPQCDNHEAFVDIALGYGWELHEYGTDNSCVVGGKDTAHLALIWLKPCAWDADQKIPVGCICCTDLDEELLTWNGELFDVMESRRIAKGEDITALPEEYPLPRVPPVLAECPTWLKPYRAH